MNTGKSLQPPSGMLTFSEVRQKIAEHLKTALNVQEFTITFAKQVGDAWRVNVEFKDKLGTMEWSRTALFEIDARTGAVKQFERGSYWRF